MLSVLKSRVVNLDESMRDVRKTIKVVEGHTAKLDSMEKQLREFVLESLSSNVEAMRGVLNSTADKLTVRDNALKAIVMALKEETKTTTRALSTRIKELKGELVVSRAVVGVQELSKAMIVVEFLIELVLSKDKFESSKPNEKGNGGEDEGQVEYSDTTK
ncbi:hypothetical protein Gotur_033235, partial [Gossypium turneri]